MQLPSAGQPHLVTVHKYEGYSALPGWLSTLGDKGLEPDAFKLSVSEEGLRKAKMIGDDGVRHPELSDPPGFWI